MKVNWGRLVPLLCLLSVACGGGGGGASDGGASDGGAGLSISTGVLGGTVDDRPWSLVTAQTVARHSLPGYFWMEAYAESRSCGLGSRTTEPFVTMVFPNVAGDYVLGSSLAANFVMPYGESFVSTTGRIRIDEITTTTIRGGAHIIFSAKHQVDGQFEAQICP